MKVTALFLGEVFCLLASAAIAKTYDLTFTGNPSTDPSVSGTGTFTTNGANDLVISGSGIFSFDASSNEPATLVPGSGYIQGQALSYDNVFPIDATAGLIFEGTTDPNFIFNIYAPTGTSLGVGTATGWASAQDGGAFYDASLPFGSQCTNCTAQGSMTITGIPELGSWALMMLGLAGLGVVGYRRGSGSRGLNDALHA